MRQKFKIIDYPLLIALALAVMYWLAESSIDVIFGLGPFTERILAVEPHELWLRSSVMLMMVLFGLYAHFAVKKLKGVQARLDLTRQSLATLGQPIIWYNLAGSIIYVNNATVSIMGYTEKELLKRKIFDIDPAMTKAGFEQLCSQLKSSRFVSFKSAKRDRSGRIFPVQVSANYCKDFGYEYIFAMIQDIEPAEQAALQLETLIKVITESPNPMLRVSYSGKILFSNPAADPLLSAWETETGKHLPSHVFEKLKSILETGRINNMETQAADRIYSFVLWANPDMDYCNLYGRDITDQKQFQESLEFTTFSLENAAENIYWLNRDGKMVYANESACRKLGYSHQEMLELSMPEIDPQYTWKDWPPFWSKLRKENYMQIESIHKTRCGIEFPVEITANYFEFRGVGYCIAFVQDITIRKQVQSQLIHRTHELSVLLHAAEKLNMTLQTDIILHELLKGAVELTGATAGSAGVLNDSRLIFKEYLNSERALPLSVTVKPGSDTVPGHVMETLKPYITNDAEHDPYVSAQLREKHGIYDLIDVPILSRRGTLLGVFEVHNSPDRRGFNTHDIEVMEGLSDIASVAIENAKLMEDRLAAEKRSDQANKSLAEKNRELESIIYVASHDLRSAIVNVQGFNHELSLSCQNLQTTFRNKTLTEECRRFLSQPLEHEIPEALNFILVSTSHIDTLINGLLQLSRISREPMEITALDINEILQEVCRNYKFQIRQADITLTIEQLPPCLGDHRLITLVFSNLIDNAIKFRDPQKRGLIKVSGFGQDTNSVYCVEDNGIGIAPEFQKKIFEIFHRLYPDTFAGEGLGLTIVRRIVERHNGSVWVESQPARGSRFFISLPSPPAKTEGEAS